MQKKRKNWSLEKNLEKFQIFFKHKKKKKTQKLKFGHHYSTCLYNINICFLPYQNRQIKDQLNIEQV